MSDQQNIGTALVNNLPAILTAAGGIVTAVLAYLKGLHTPCPPPKPKKPKGGG